MDILQHDQRLLADMKKELAKLSRGPEATLQIAGSVKGAHDLLAQFRKHDSRRTYDLAIINLNLFPSAEALAALLGPDGLGDARIVFLVSLRTIQSPIYAVAREKVEREAAQAGSSAGAGAPSCIDTYTPANRRETIVRVAQIANAYLEETALWAKARGNGMPVLSVLSPATELLRRSNTVFAGRRPGSGRNGAVPSTPSTQAAASAQQAGAPAGNGRPQAG
jgi:hypothetical protein